MPLLTTQTRTNSEEKVTSNSRLKKKHDLARGPMCGPQCQIRKHGQRPPGTVPDFAQGTSDQIHKLSGHNDAHTEDIPVTPSGLGAGTLKTGHQLEGGRHGGWIRLWRLDLV